MAVNKLQLIRRRRALRPTRKVIPKQAHPLGIEREYARALKGMMSAINAQVQSALAPLLKPGARRDAPEDFHISGIKIPASDDDHVTHETALRNAGFKEIAKTEVEAGKQVLRSLPNGHEAMVTLTGKVFKNGAVQFVGPHGGKETGHSGFFVREASAQAPAVTAPAAIAVAPVDIRAPLHEVLAKLHAIRAETTVTAQKAGLLAQGIGTKTSKFNKVAMGDQIKAVIGVDPLATLSEPGTPGILEDFIAENVKLIESIPERYFQEVGEFLGDAVPSGKRAEDVAALIQERYNVSESRANLIARDQVSKLNGNLTKVRQEGLGITGYTWRTSLDERVRPSHAALEGQRFDWASPPAIGAPGEDFQCRCRAEPDLSALIGSDD